MSTSNLLRNSFFFNLGAEGLFSYRYEIWFQWVFLEFFNIEIRLKGASTAYFLKKLVKIE